MAAYGDNSPPSHYEYDHFVPIELGGATNDPRNLWPEPGASPNPKDSIEEELNRRVCEHRMTLAQAQRAIATNWVKLRARGPHRRHPGQPARSRSGARPAPSTALGTATTTCTSTRTSPTRRCRSPVRAHRRAGTPTTLDTPTSTSTSAPRPPETESPSTSAAPRVQQRCSPWLPSRATGRSHADFGDV